MKKSFLLYHKLTFSSPGSTVEDLVPQLNIVVQAETGGSLTDPLNVIPDDYEDYEYTKDVEDVVDLKAEYIYDEEYY